MIISECKMHRWLQKQKYPPTKINTPTKVVGVTNWVKDIQKLGVKNAVLGYSPNQPNHQTNLQCNYHEIL
jgi:hypothetical protein